MSLQHFLGEQVEKDKPVPIVIEKRFLPVSACGQVIESAGKLKA